MIKVKNIFKKVKNDCSKFKQTLIAIVNALVIAYITSPIPVFAASYTAPLVKLKIAFIAIIASAGVIVLLYGVIKFAESFQKKDQNGEYSAIYTIVAGGIMTGISAFIAVIS